jgi:hypothetical protein
VRLTLRNTVFQRLNSLQVWHSLSMLIRERLILQEKLSIWKMTLIYPGMNGFRLVLSSAEIALNTVFAACLMDRAM